MDMDVVTEISDETMFGCGNVEHGQAVATVVSAMATPVVASPSLPSFRDMVARQSPAGQRVNMISEFDVDLTDDDVVANRRRHHAVQRRAPNQLGLTVASNGGSRFDVLADVTEPQHNERKLMPTSQGNVGITLLPRVSNGLRHAVSPRTLGPNHASMHRIGDSARDVGPSFARDGGRVEAGMELRNVTMQDMDGGAQPSDGCAVVDAMVNGLAITTVVEDNIVIPSVAAKGKVVAAPSSLQ
ncbi:hypothetical protein V6N12_047376 [Hibiscus sabdariffa]|uniref:Uncharacterized protein n=1 Tax=Hibiscus sabdariffa TaxID=183260 RepID=A0ABR2DCE0_9ROSI